MPRRRTEAPILLRDLLHQNFLHRPDRLQVALQACQQMTELSFRPAIYKRQALGEQTVPPTVPGTPCLALRCLWPVDFFAFFRLASIFRGEDPFVGSARLCVDSVAAGTVTVSVDCGVASTCVDAAGCEADTASSPAGIGALMFAELSSMIETSNAAGGRFCLRRDCLVLQHLN